ncbi:MAG: hypothetical protein IH586_14455, partial [Anaerolineaceae bacterium]|nr:hypothetical protein [Anaerolineaceae bacterium]
MLTDCADLEISLHHSPNAEMAGEYAAEYRFNQPGSEVEIRQVPGQPALVLFDLAHLRSLPPAAYGMELSKALFAGEIGKAYAQARAAADVLDLPLRLRLLAGPSAPELNGLQW